MLLTLSSQDTHLWRVFLPDWIMQKSNLMMLLNETERQRAYRFKFEIHRERFIIAHAFLRKILNLYTNISPEKIEFIHGKREKPYLKDNQFNLQFNISHSNDVAIYAITQQSDIGVDIEKMEDKYKGEVAKRFFSVQEYSELSKLSVEYRTKAFYKIWVKKEAVIKALGEGLYAPLSDFSVHWDQQEEEIMMNHAKIYLYDFNVDYSYSAAVAMFQPIKRIHYWEWKEDTYYSLPCFSPTAQT